MSGLVIFLICMTVAMAIVTIWDILSGSPPWQR